MKIHSSAVVDPAAVICDDVEIGPLSVIESDVVIAEGCRILHRVVIKNGTTVGPGNTVCEGAVLGGLPQHVNVPERPGRLVIGAGNMIRENVTFHRAMAEDGETVVGDNNLFMVNTHVAHDCRVGNHTIFANNSMLAGHVTVGDRAYLSGAAAVHQFCRIGSLAMVGGQSHVNKDVPPFITLDGLSSHVVGLNTIGLRRAGFASDEIQRLKQAYRVIYRSGLCWNDVLQRLRDEFPEGAASQFYQFLSTTTRGIMAERRLPPGAVVRLPNEEEESQPQLRSFAG
ncbi:MAG: acyl-ACP--UDP-N-acetylglucosamine O-acyltransferase [Planctomycetaceae bacterium]|nr:acyl-ACP--UDP-N-acetylglucosamine O-acyltransferase [Planctomycetaceae bacterium]